MSNAFTRVLMPYGTRGASPGAWPVRVASAFARLRLRQAERVLRRAPERLSALRHPFIGLAKQRCKARAQKSRRGNEMGCLKSE